MLATVITTGNGGISLSDVWPLLAVMFAGAAGVFGFMAKHVQDLGRENRKLQDKIVDDVVPAMVENTLASKAMIEASVRLQTALAVAEERSKGRTK